MDKIKSSWILMKANDYLNIKLSIRAGGNNNKFDAFNFYKYMNFEGINLSSYINIILSPIVKDQNSENESEIAFAVSDWPALKVFLDNTAEWFTKKNPFIYRNEIVIDAKKERFYMTTHFGRHLATVPTIVTDRDTGHKYEGVSLYLKEHDGAFASLTRDEFFKLKENLKLSFNCAIPTGNSMMNTFLLLKILKML